MFKAKKEQPVKIQARKRNDDSFLNRLLPPNIEHIDTVQNDDDKIPSFLLEEEEEEEEESLDSKAKTSIDDSEQYFEEFRMPRINYNKKFQIFDFKYKGLPVTVKNDYNDYQVQICQAKINYKQTMQFLSFLDPDFVSIIEYIRSKYKHIIDYQDKKFEQNMQLYEKIAEVEQKIEDIDTNIEKYPHFNRFFQVPKDEKIMIQDRAKQKEKSRLKQQINNIKNLHRSKSRKNIRQNSKINHKKK